MDNQNPAEMSNSDLENEMKNNNKDSGNQELVNKSTAAEGNLIDPSKDPHSVNRVKPAGDDERDLDDLVHTSEDEDSQDGSLPDPEELGDWERRDDPNKISG